MHSSKMSHCLFFLLSMTLARLAVSQDVVYPKIEETPYVSGNNPVITERIPVYIPDRCPENMLLYPGAGNKSTWMCDCKPGFLYFPLNNTCHAAYSQGPCLPGSYVYLPKGEAVPTCVENPCSQRDQVPFDGRCYTLGNENESPCGIGSTLRVNPLTFQLECSAEIVTQFIAQAPRIVERNPCPPGQRIFKGQCKTPL